MARQIKMAPACGHTGGKARERLGKRTYKYTPDHVFAQLLEVRISELRRHVNAGTLPAPCRSTEACDWWFEDTVWRILGEINSGRIWLGKPHG